MFVYDCYQISNKRTKSFGVASYVNKNVLIFVLSDSLDTLKMKDYKEWIAGKR